MRSSTLLACLVPLTACAAAPAPPVADAVFAHRTAAANVAAVDAVTAELLAAALRTSESVRGIHLANLANAQLPGYKRRVPLYGSRPLEGGLTVPVLLGSRPVTAQGTIERTERSLDLAVDGDGMFAVRLGDGRIGYTRDGSLRVDADGRLVDGRGCVLIPEITLPSDLLDLAVDPEGRVTGRTAGNPTAVTSMGQLTLCRFVAAEGLRDAGDGTWRETPDSGPPLTSTPGAGGFGTIQQGFLERSNVDTGRESLALQAVERNRQALLAVVRSLGLVAE